MNPISCEGLTKEEILESFKVALAENYTSPQGQRNPDWDHELPESQDNPLYLSVPIEERTKQSPRIVFVAGDGNKSLRYPTIEEIVETLSHLIKDT